MVSRVLSTRQIMWEEFSSTDISWEEHITVVRNLYLVQEANNYCVLEGKFNPFQQLLEVGTRIKSEQQFSTIPSNLRSTITV